MWGYEKRLQYPVKITQTNPKIAQIIITQFGGPDGELAASMRYLSQRYTMPYKEVTGILTDIGTEELAHMEMICAIVHQLTRNLTPEEIEKSGFGTYYVCLLYTSIPDHGFASAGRAKFIRISDGLPRLPCFFVFFILANLDTYTAPAKGIHTLPLRLGAS